MKTNFIPTESKHIYTFKSEFNKTKLVAEVQVDDSGSIGGIVHLSYEDNEIKLGSSTEFFNGRETINRVNYVFFPGDFCIRKNVYYFMTYSPDCMKLLDDFFVGLRKSIAQEFNNILQAETFKDNNQEESDYGREECEMSIEED